MRGYPLVLSFSLLVPSLSAQGKLELSGLFADHMVLQRDVALPIWGTTDAGAKVTVRFGGRMEAVKANDDGTWKLMLKKMPAGGPHELVVEAGGTKKVIKDVLVGEVWLASGQSNMQWTVRQSKDAEKENIGASFSNLRMFTVRRVTARTPQKQCQGAWKMAMPTDVLNFSAAAYFFGRELHNDLGVPVGLITSAWGGTAIEAWTSAEAQAGKDWLRPVFEPWRKRAESWDPEKAAAQFEKQMANWRQRAEAARAAGTRVPRRPRKQGDPSLDRNHPTALFDGMIAPLIPYAIRGAIWYQGERNARNIQSATLYRQQLPLLIQDWRGRWNNEFPFAWVQLPNFKKRVDDPGADSAWAVMRESMAESLSVSKTGMAITIDVGEAGNIHPKDKQSVGARLAMWALADVYGKKIPASGPLFASAKVDSAKFHIGFKHAYKGLRPRDGKAIKGFAIRDAAGKWRWAEASCPDGGHYVTVWHKDVAKPTAVRYAWGDNPDCNLVNSAGLPASPFRTKR